jgi:hypothetical protein
MKVRTKNGVDLKVITEFLDRPLSGIAKEKNITKFGATVR